VPPRSPKVGVMLNKTVHEKQTLSHTTLGFKRSNTEIQQLDT